MKADRLRSGSLATSHRATGGAMSILMVGALVATGCGVVNAARKAVHAVEGNKATIDTFTGRINPARARHSKRPT